MCEILDRVLIGCEIPDGLLESSARAEAPEWDEMKSQATKLRRSRGGRGGVGYGSRGANPTEHVEHAHNFGDRSCECVFSWVQMRTRACLSHPLRLYVCFQLNICWLVLQKNRLHATEFSL
eukprot:4980607-Pyramimonas_sp.AAC.1